MGFMYCLDVGFGDATVIKTIEETYLIDCHDIGNHYEFLPKNKFIRGVFITHQHKDHYSGLQLLKDENYSVQHLIYCPYDRRYGDNSVTIEEWDMFIKNTAQVSRNWGDLIRVRKHPIARTHATV